MKSQLWDAAFPLQLTPNQAQILSLVRRFPNGAKLKEIAAELGVAPATASDAVSLLEEKHYLSKQKNPKNQRSIIVRLTKSGEAIEERTRVWPDFLEESLDTLSSEEQELLLRIIIKLISSFQERNEISPARMCISCKFFEAFKYSKTSTPHHCHFVDAPFGDRYLRIDCSDHQIADSDKSREIWLQRSHSHETKSA